MKKALLLGGGVVSGFLALCGASAQDVAPLAAGQVGTLEQAVGAAIDTQPEVRARWAAFQASESDRSAARAGYLPSIDVNGEFGATARDYDGRGWYTRGRAEVSVSQMLFDGFFTSSRVKQAGQTRVARYFELMDAVQQKALEAIVAYEDVRQYRATVALAEQNLTAHADVLKLMQERTVSGVGTGADLEQASGRYALAQSNLLTEQANLHDVTARFQRIVGQLPAPVLADFQVAADQVPTSFDAIMTEATRRHPTLFAANANVEAARAAVTEAQSGYYPRLSAEARAGTYRNNNSFDSRYDPRNRGEEAFVGVNVTYNLFRGGGDKARENAASYRLEQSRDLLDKACVDLRQTAAISLNNVENLKLKMRSLDAHRVGSGNVARAYEQQFYIGRRSLLDVLDAKNEAFQSERSYVLAEHELTRSYYRTLYSMGTLLDVLQQNRAGVPTLGAIDPKGRQPAAIDCSASAAPGR